MEGYVNSFINIPSKLVESNIRVLCMSLKQDTLRAVATLRNDKNQIIEAPQYVKCCEAAHTNSPLKNMQNTSPPSIRTENSLSDSPSLSSNNKTNELYESSKLNEDLNLSRDKKQSGPVLLKQKSKSFTSHKERFFEIKADMSRQDVIDQEVRIMKSRRSIRSESMPENILMISGRGRYARVVHEQYKIG